MDFMFKDFVNTSLLLTSRDLASGLESLAGCMHSILAHLCLLAYTEKSGAEKVMQVTVAMEDCA